MPSTHAGVLLLGRVEVVRPAARRSPNGSAERVVGGIGSAAPGVRSSARELLRSSAVRAVAAMLQPAHRHLRPRFGLLASAGLVVVGVVAAFAAARKSSCSRFSGCCRYWPKSLTVA